MSVRRMAMAPGCPCFHVEIDAHGSGWSMISMIAGFKFFAKGLTLDETANNLRRNIETEYRALSTTAAYRKSYGLSLSDDRQHLLNVLEYFNTTSEEHLKNISSRKLVLAVPDEEEI